MMKREDQVNTKSLRVDRRMFFKIASAVSGFAQLGFGQGRDANQPPRRHSQAPVRIETTEWGSHLPDKPYFPVCLANGVDAMLIDLLGSGDSWQADYGTPLSEVRSRGWFKCDRRAHTKDPYEVGTLFPLFEFASSPILNGGRAVPRNCKQYFDPRKAMLTSFYEQKDDESEGWLRFKVTTFLTKQHVLVEHYEFLETPSSGAAIVFFLNAPPQVAPHYFESAIKMNSATLEVEPKKSLMDYSFTLERFQGGGRSWFDCESATGKASDKKEDELAYGELQTRVVHTGESFTRYLAAIDNEDAGDYRAALDAAIAECRELGYERLRGRHEKEWQDYFAVSQVEIPDPVIAYLYDVSRYRLRSLQHPSGFVPAGDLPYLWQGLMFWDSTLAVEAWLGCGNTQEAGKVLAHLETYMEDARKLARRLSARGARLEWTVGIKKFMDGDPIGLEPQGETYSNSVWAHAIYSYFQNTQDTRFLEEHFHVLEEYMLFQVDYTLVDRGDHFIVRRAEGIDETVPRVNDTYSCAIILRALTDYREAARILKRQPAIARLDEIISKLRVGLNRNVDAGGVLQSFEGGRLPHWGSLIFDLFPDHPALRPTLTKMMENYDPELKLYNLQSVIHHSLEKAFPWANYWAVRCFARGGDPRATMLLQSTVQSVNYFGGMPERVWYHGELFKNWFMTAHSAMIWAVNGMLTNANGSTLHILSGGAQRAWADVKFEGIHAGEGLVVSAEVRAGQLTSLDVVNLSSHTRDVECLFGETAGRWKFSLQPGKTRCLPQAKADTPRQS
jgi:hypothetical protein